MTVIYRWLFSALGLLLIDEFVAGIRVEGLYVAIIAALILGVLNAIVRPVLFVLTLPVTILTLGLFAFVINAGLFLFAASFIDGFEVDSFWYALLGSILMSVIGVISNWFIKRSVN